VDQRGVRNVAVSRHDDLWFGRNHVVEDANPPAAVYVGVKGRKVREDGEHARLEQVTSEQHAIVDENGLVASTVRRTHAAQDDSVSTEVDLRLAVVAEVRIDELHVIELSRVMNYDFEQAKTGRIAEIRACGVGGGGA
jgi:hypothetical protein